MSKPAFLMIGLTSFFSIPAPQKDTETAATLVHKAGGILFPDQRLGKFSRNSFANIKRNVRKIFMPLLTQPSRSYRTFRFAI